MIIRRHTKQNRHRGLVVIWTFSHQFWSLIEGTPPLPKFFEHNKILHNTSHFLQPIPFAAHSILSSTPNRGAQWRFNIISQTPKWLSSISATWKLVNNVITKNKIPSSPESPSYNEIIKHIYQMCSFSWNSRKQKPLSIQNFYTKHLKMFWVFRWFEEVARDQKYVYSSFMVKMRINFGSVELFWFNLGWRQCLRKEFVKFKFLGWWDQKVQIWKCRKYGVLM